MASASTVASLRTPARDSPGATDSAAGRPSLLADFGQHRLGHQMRQPRAELAFLLVGKALGQPLGDQQAEHAVADEFQPLVGARAAAPRGAPARQRPADHGGAVGQRLAQQFRAGEIMAEHVRGAAASTYGAAPRAGAAAWVRRCP